MFDSIPGHRRALIALIAALLTGLTAAPGARAAGCDAPANAIVAENCQPGTPASVWDISTGDDATIKGFATEMSVVPGQVEQFKVDTPASAYRIEIYRLGWYGGDGARLVDTVHPTTFGPQPDCNTDATTKLVDCGNWSVSASWQVPATAVSGIYLAHLVREDGTHGEAHIAFVVRNDGSHSDLLFQTSDTTWQAYNQFGGHSLYYPDQDSRAYKVSYNRPFITRDGNTSEDWLFNSEYPMVRFLERNGYDVSYISGADTDRYGGLLRQHKVFMSVGHDEYWSGGQRANVEASRAAGVNLAFFSGNESFWKTRWEDDHRTLVTYKETHAGAKIDPSPEWTGSWRDPRFSPPADGGRPENALTGQLFMVNDGSAALEVPAADGKLRFWRNSSVASQPAGATATLTPDSIGYEWDEDVDNGVRPAGLVDLSSTTVDDVQLLQDYGSNFGQGTATHHLTVYRAPSGALVFGAGTIQWPWGLDATHDRGPEPTSPAMQQATVNLLADMHAQPASLDAGLAPAAASTDTIAPTSTITSAPSGAVQAGAPATIAGTAADAGGGRVGAVEVSLDGGATWHPAIGRENWSYTWTPSVTGTVAPRSRAIDDSGNIGPPPPPAPPAAGTGHGSTGSGASPAKHGLGIRIAPRRVRMSRRGKVTLRVACPRRERGCRVRLSLRRGRRTVAAGKTLSVRAGASRRFTLKLSRSARRTLVHKRSLTVTAVATVRTRAGHRATLRIAVRLLAPRKHRTVAS